MEIRNTEAELQRFRLRAWVMSVVVLLAFGLVVARLLVLQVQRHEELSERAESNRTAVVPIVPNRGQILDRNGVVLATNYSAYTLEIMPRARATLKRPSTAWPRSSRSRRATGASSSAWWMTPAASTPCPSARA